jgi:hypothetical protein
MKRNSADSAPLVAQLTYKLGDVTYVPHFRNSSVYIGPGYPRENQERYSSDQLVSAGAIATNNLLWIRANHGIITDRNP